MSTTIHVRSDTPAGNASLCHTRRHAHTQQALRRTVLASHQW
jgi:hypothetical protein